MTGKNEYWEYEERSPLKAPMVNIAPQSPVVISCDYSDKPPVTAITIIKRIGNSYEAYDANWKLISCGYIIDVSEETIKELGGQLTEDTNQFEVL